MTKPRLYLSILCSVVLVYSQQQPAPVAGGGGGNFQQQQQQQNFQAAPPQQPQQFAQQQQQQAQQPVQQQQDGVGPPAGNRHVAEPIMGTKMLKDHEECKGDIIKYCSRLDLNSDMDLLLCLQDVGYSETKATLVGACENLIWEYKKNLTVDEKFRHATEQFCQAEMTANPMMRGCGNNPKPGFTLSCMISWMPNITRSSKCFQFLYRAEQLAFSDFFLVGPFVEKCEAVVKKLGCGQLTPDAAHAQVRVPHSQGSTLECLIKTLVNVSKQQDMASLIDEGCRHEVMRIAELQAEDFHLDRPLFFACREDRERFCKAIPAGNGKVFECLLEHQHEQTMDPQCKHVLSERASLMGQNYQLAHPLVDACAAELKQYSCSPQNNKDVAAHFHLSWVLLCLESAVHNAKAKMNEQCQHEMLTHRQMLMSDYHLSPELMLGCARELDMQCSDKGVLEKAGGSLHCLMGLQADRTKQHNVSPQCLQALNTVVQVADVGRNYQVDKVLYGSCKPLIDGVCAMDLQSETATLQCLMKHLDNHDMTDECEKRLLEVQYFLAREWTLDPELYNACQVDAKEKCGAVDNWHKQTGSDYRTNPGPQVLTCLYRAGYDEQHPLHPDCANNVRRLLRTRAVRVNLIPDLEENCRGALGEFCSTHVKPSEEMMCLQEHLESPQMKDKYKDCRKALTEFTEMESRDTKLNRLLTKACKPVIATYCQEFANEEIDHGDVMECLSNHKEKAEMTPKCRSYVHHFELVSMRDYHFSFKFKQACSHDIGLHCANQNNDKGDIIRCLSSILFEHRVLGNDKDLSKDCKKQLRVAYLQQEQVDFDDKDHMQDADPKLMKQCANDISRLQCANKKTFEQVIECLREHFNELAADCKALVFEREKVEAVDNELDVELQRICQKDIAMHCSGDVTRALECLSNTKILRILRPVCQKLVINRMGEHGQDARLRPGLLEACKEESQRLCAADYAKLKNTAYQKLPLDGVLVNCLRDKYRRNEPFGQACKEELSKAILESEFDLRADPQLFKACKATIQKHCHAVVISPDVPGQYSSILECLKADFDTGAIKDRECSEQLARRMQESMVDIHLDPALHEACATDIQRLCHDVPPGQSRLITCLMDALSNTNTAGRMTKSCHSKLKDRHRLWKKAHEEYQMPMPDSLGGLFNLLVEHPQRTSILSWLGIFVCVLFFIGCCCGRATKRVRREMKNR